MSRPIATCSIEGCEERAHAAGLCNTHYRRRRRGGAVIGPLKATLDPTDRWTAMADRSTGADACWPWRGTHTPDGYGLFRVGSRTDGSRRQVLAHRWGYEHFRGPIPTERELDHVRCDDRGCVNPRHVELSTHAANTLRSSSPQAANAAKTHCPKGHEYTPANTYRRPGAKGSSRQCRACKRGDRVA